jgi:hypothetical protein
MTVLILSLLLKSFYFTDPDPLACIDEHTSLTLIYENGKCGEWGGNVEKFVFYRKQSHGDLFAWYYLYQKDCANPTVANKLIVEKFDIKVQQGEKQLIADAVQELASGILKKPSEFFHEGSNIHVYLSDSTINLKLAPAKSWEKFEQIKSSLNKR